MTIEEEDRVEAQAMEADTEDTIPVQEVAPPESAAPEPVAPESVAPAGLRGYESLPARPPHSRNKRRNGSAHTDKPRSPTSTFSLGLELPSVVKQPSWKGVNVKRWPAIRTPKYNRAGIEANL